MSKVIFCIYREDIGTTLAAFTQEARALSCITDLKEKHKWVGHYMVRRLEVDVPFPSVCSSCGQEE